MKLMIVRHGETDYNVQGLIQGQKDTDLTENGKRQAKALAEFLKDEKIDNIISSPLKRASNTAEEINRFHSLEIKKEPLLKERSFGKVEGQPGYKLDEENPGCLKDLKFRPEKGENVYDVLKRLEPFVENLLEKKAEKKTILIVAHKVVILCLFAIILGKNIDEVYRWKQDSTASNIIDIDETKTQLNVFNSTEHLELKGLKKIKERKGIC